VNNFSEVSVELLDEAKEEIKAGHQGNAVNVIDEAKDNLQKIVHHGQRADAIVKGMLQHSRQSKGEKESSDLNALADEYLRLSYHGFRAKDKDFNAGIKTHFDPSIREVAVIPQDIGRVLLNLFNNAFYAVHEKQQQLNGQYEPMVSVHTKRDGNNVQIIVHDNGTGMSPKVAEKVFQPFFTTKPTGEGTGLGLSLSYDIVTKGHAGTLTVRSTEGVGSEFVVTLPVT
jgi:signal transduction histidine kinase